MLRQVVSNAYIKSFWDGYHLAPALSSVKPRLLPLDDESPVLLAVEGTLVLQPAPVILDTGDFFAVVVRNRVLRAARGGISAVSLDTCVEALLLLQKLSASLVISCCPLVITYLCNGSVPASPARPKLETSSTKRRPAHPSCDCYREGGHTEDDERVHARDLCSPCVDVLVRDDRRSKANSSKGSDNRGSKVDEAALAPKVKEAVPGQDLGRRSGRRIAAAGRGLSGELRLALRSDPAGRDLGCDRRKSCCGCVGAAKLFQWRG
jgi:hypothetical protein